MTETTDRHLLKDVQNQLGCAHLVNIMKTLMLISSDLLKQRYSSQPGVFLSIQIRSDNIPKEYHDLHIFLRNAPKDAADMAFQVLKIICSEAWVKEKCLKDSEKFVACMLDKRGIILPRVESQLLIELISHPTDESCSDEIEKFELESYVQGILHNLKIWTIRQSLTKLLHLFHTNDQGARRNSPDQTVTEMHSNTLGMGVIDKTSVSLVARLISSIFESTPSSKIKSMKNFPGLKREVSSIWLLAPLASKLPDVLHLKIHANATLMLETGSKFGNDKAYDRGSEHSRMQQPFLNLVLACLEKQQLERKNLMDKLVDQLQMFIEENKDKVKKLEWPKVNSLVENLQLRLALLGGMFDTVLAQGAVQVSNLLIQLVTFNIADRDRFPELYYTCVDMLGLILHTLQGGDAITDIIGIPAGMQKREANRPERKKIESKIVKRIGADCSERDQYDSLRQLIPIQKESDQRFDIIRYERIPAQDKKHRNGLRPVAKEKVNPWDLIEGLKENPICLSWFGASRAEREPEEWQYRERTAELRQQAGQIVEKRKFEDWLKLPDLPSEDEEPPPQKLKQNSDNMQINQSGAPNNWQNQANNNPNHNTGNMPGIPQHMNNPFPMSKSAKS